MNDPTRSFDAKAIVERAKYLMRVGSDRELAETAGIEYQTLVSWKKRNSIPLQAVIDLAGKSGCLLDYLVFGERFVDPIGSPPRIDSAIMDIALRMVSKAAKVDEKIIPKLVYETTFHYIVLANMVDSLVKSGTDRISAIKRVEKTSIDIGSALEETFGAI